MNKDTWERLKNLSLFKLWVTDDQLRRLWLVAALIATAILLFSVIGYVFFWYHLLASTLVARHPGSSSIYRVRHQASGRRPAPDDLARDLIFARNPLLW